MSHKKERLIEYICGCTYLFLFWLEGMEDEHPDIIAEYLCDKHKELIYGPRD